MSHPPGYPGLPGLPSAYQDIVKALAGLLGKKYVHISFYFPPSLPEIEASHHIQPIINTADDWLKYANNCWLVWSAQMPKQWYEKFRTVKQLENCSILIINVDLSPDNRAGQLPQWVWDWIQKPRT